MMSTVTTSFLRFFLPLVTLVSLAVLIAVSLAYAFYNHSLGMYITASMLVGFAVIPVVLLADWVQRNNRVLIRDRKLEVRYHSNYKRCPEGLKEFVASYPFIGVMNSIEAEISSHPTLTINRGFLTQNTVIEFCPSEVLQESPRSEMLMVTGLQYGNKVMVTWKPEDLDVTKKLISHELGHVLIWLNYPVLSEERHHEILAKCHM